MNQQPDITNNERVDSEIEIDLIELFSYYRTKLLWIIAAFVIGALIAGLVTQFAMTPKYTSTAKMYMVSSSSQSVVDLTDFNIGQSLSSDYVELLKTRTIVESVIQEQSLPYSYEQLIGMLNVSVVADTRILSIQCTSPDKKEAMNIANALAEKGVTELPKLMETPEPHIAEYAIVAVNKSSPSLTKNTMIGALLGLLLMLGLCTIRFLTDDTFKTAEDIEKAFGVMPLTVIPEGKIEGMQSEEKGKKRKKTKKRKKGKKYGSVNRQ